MMNRRVRRKIVKYRVSRAKESLLYAEDEGDSGLSHVDRIKIDWTRLPHDTVIALFTLLDYRDRARLSSVCKTWHSLGDSPCLWKNLDMRAHTLDQNTAAHLAKKCSNLHRLRFRGAMAASSIISLKAYQLEELIGDNCRELTDASLSMLAARHVSLCSLQLGPDCERISSDAIRVIALCCPNLKRLRLIGVRDVDRDAIEGLVKHCIHISELGFIDSAHVDDVALSISTSLRFLSLAGLSNIQWNLAAQSLSKIPSLVAIDVSRTQIPPSAVGRLLSMDSLKVLCALNCSNVEEGSGSLIYSPKRKILLARFTDLVHALVSLTSYASMENKESFHQFEWDCHTWQPGSKNCLELLNWTEWVLSHALLRIADSNTLGLDSFWLKQGTSTLLHLAKSTQEEVQERAATALATFVVTDDVNATVDPCRAEAVMHGGGISLLLKLAKSCREGVQSEAAKAIANLSVNAEVAKRVAVEGGISILAMLARSPNRWVAEEAAGGLWNLSVGEEHKGTIAETGGIKALVELVFKWPSGGDGVLERAAGALANLAADDKCSMEVATTGGVHALVTLARLCKHEGVQEQAARALANLAAHGDSNGNNAAVGQEVGALEALVQLTSSQSEGVRQESAGALWNLSFDDRNREAIAAAGGVEALVALAQSCSTGSHGLQERAAGALWGLSVSEANSIAIGREGGVVPLITLAYSEAEDVHETAAGALWNLAFNPGNAWRIVEEGGVRALVHLCSSSVSKMARFMAALALAYMFDGRMDAVTLGATFCENVMKNGGLDGARRLAMRHIEAFLHGFSNQHALTAASVSGVPSALMAVADSARIQEAGHLRCSVAEIGRFVTMLRNGSPVLRACAAFAILQFTMPGGRHAIHHVNLLQNAGAGRVLRAAAAAATAPLQAKVFARIVLRNLEQCNVDVLNV